MKTILDQCIKSSDKNHEFMTNCDEDNGAETPIDHVHIMTNQIMVILPNFQFSFTYIIMSHHAGNPLIQDSVKGGASANQNHEEYLDAESTRSQIIQQNFTEDHDVVTFRGSCN